MNENYLIEVLDAIGEKLQEQKKEIYFKDLQIADLKKALEEAEKEIESLKSQDTTEAQSAWKVKGNGKEV